MLRTGRTSYTRRKKGSRKENRKPRGVRGQKRRKGAIQHLQKELGEGRRNTEGGAEKKAAVLRSPSNLKLVELGFQGDWGGLQETAPDKTSRKMSTGPMAP